MADDDPILFDVGIHAIAKRKLVNDYEEDQRLYVIDHGNSLCGQNGTLRFVQSKSKIGLFASTHDLTRAQRGWQHFDTWKARILAAKLETGL